MTVLDFSKQFGITEYKALRCSELILKSESVFFIQKDLDITIGMINKIINNLIIYPYNRSRLMHNISMQYYENEQVIFDSIELIYKPEMLKGAELEIFNNID